MTRLGSRDWSSQRFAGTGVACCYSGKGEGLCIVCIVGALAWHPLKHAIVFSTLVWGGGRRSCCSTCAVATNASCCRMPPTTHVAICRLKEGHGRGKRITNVLHTKGVREGALPQIGTCRRILVHAKVRSAHGMGLRSAKPKEPELYLPGAMLVGAQQHGPDAQACAPRGTKRQSGQVCRVTQCRVTCMQRRRRHAPKSARLLAGSRQHHIACTHAVQSWWALD